MLNKLSLNMGLTQKSCDTLKNMFLILFFYIGLSIKKNIRKILLGHHQMNITELPVKEKTQ